MKLSKKLQDHWYYTKQHILSYDLRKLSIISVLVLLTTAFSVYSLEKTRLHNVMKVKPVVLVSNARTQLYLSTMNMGPLRNGKIRYKKGDFETDDISDIFKRTKFKGRAEVRVNPVPESGIFIKSYSKKRIFDLIPYVQYFSKNEVEEVADILNGLEVFIEYKDMFDNTIQYSTKLKVGDVK